ncbi:hypothetical protein DESAMIL20_1366 [Desulfurella amilsii]|uniref:Uncharacterized protein n=1 Tax=Desulfurella amilsii TaxID=1562698 RepID=A0A1X4XWA3_9BACT|nr:hypothetical protein DESAMIL20_1366 [Desulfurella amilsii]
MGDGFSSTVNLICLVPEQEYTEKIVNNSKKALIFLST